MKKFFAIVAAAVLAIGMSAGVMANDPGGTNAGNDHSEGNGNAHGGNPNAKGGNAGGSDNGKGNSSKDGQGKGNL